MTLQREERNYRARELDKGSAIAVRVVGVDLSGEPMVNVAPIAKQRVQGFNGEVEYLEPLEIQSIPYSFPSSGSFAVFTPPEVGMEGFLVSTDNEVGEISAGQHSVNRTRDRSSGFFMPAGKLSGGSPFIGSPNWAEMRSENARIAMSGDTVHLQSAGVSFQIGPSGFDMTVNGVSFVSMLKQISEHIADIENITHPHDGDGHGGQKQRLVDDLIALADPQRNEGGVR